MYRDTAPWLGGRYRAALPLDTPLDGAVRILAGRAPDADCRFAVTSAAHPALRTAPDNAGYLELVPMDRFDFRDGELLEPRLYKPSIVRGGELGAPAWSAPLDRATALAVETVSASPVLDPLCCTCSPVCANTTPQHLHLRRWAAPFTALLAVMLKLRGPRRYAAVAVVFLAIGAPGALPRPALLHRLHRLSGARAAVKSAI